MATDGYFAALSRRAVANIFGDIAKKAHVYNNKEGLYWYRNLQLGSKVRTTSGAKGVIVSLAIQKHNRIEAGVIFGSERTSEARVFQVAQLTQIEADDDEFKLHDCSNFLSGHGENDGEKGSSLNVGDCVEKTQLKMRYPMDEHGYGLFFNGGWGQAGNPMRSYGKFLTAFFAENLAKKGVSLCFSQYEPLRQYRKDMQMDDNMKTKKGVDCYSKDFALMHSIKLRPAYEELSRVIL